MMVLRRGLPAKLALTDADDTRWDLNALVMCDAAGVPRSGISSPVGTNLLTATATMNIAVGKFNGNAVRDGGTVLLANDGTTNVLLDAAPGANSRLDVIYAKQNDSSGTVSVPDANDLSAFGVLEGVAAPSPVRNPAGLPAGALELGTVEIPYTATATNSAGVIITQTAQFTAAAGGQVGFRTKAAMDATTTLRPGTQGWVIGDVCAYIFNGTVWVPTTGTPLFTGSYPTFGATTATFFVVNPTGGVSRAIAKPGTTQFSPTAPGYYRIKGAAAWDSSAGGVRVIKLNKNSGGNNAVGLLRQNTVTPAATTPFPFMQETDVIVPLNGATDYVEMFVYQSSGSTLQVVASLEISFVSAL